MSSISKLIFTPENFQQSAPLDALRDGLLNLGWLGGKFDHGPSHSFFIGDRFFQYITFMGCAPAMRLEPAGQDDLNFCFIRIQTKLSKPLFRGHHERFVPRCPVCRHGLPDWQVQLDQWQTDPTAQFNCPHCGEVLAIPELNWREKAAIGRCFIEVYSVYPHEGIPTPAFMDQLKELSGINWKYFFEPS